MKTIYIGLAVFLLFLTFGFEQAQACTCVRRATCEFSATATAVFVGRVLDSRVEERAYRYSDDPRETPIKGKFQISRVAVKEAFFGIENEKEIEFETDNFSSCSFSFEKDVEYVIYADRDEKNGKYSTGFCSGTKPVQFGGEDLKYLRAQKIASGSTVKGFVAFNAKNKNHLSEPPENNFAALAKLGISTVRLENETNKFMAVIADDSTYGFQNIPRGKYKLSVVLPAWYKTLDNYSQQVAKDLGIELGTVELTGFGCKVENFTVVRAVAKKKRGK